MEIDFGKNLTNEIKAQVSTEAVPLFLDFVSRHAWEAGFDDEKISQISLAVEEALGNIMNFACTDGAGEITISCNTHESGALIINITDTGVPFNMLIASTFPEAGDFTKSGQIPSTKIMKKAIGNIEYRRDVDRNILIFTVMRML